MYSLMTEWLSDKKGGAVFTCFGGWHLCYIALFVAISVIAVCYLKYKDIGVRRKWIGFFINLSFGLYIADFFLMPFAYKEIDIEKLPFHICTAMCVMCFWSNHNHFLGKFRRSFALLGFISNLIYLVYPAGVMWHQVHPLSYRVIQTLTFHGLMTVYGLLVLVFENKTMKRNVWVHQLTILVGMTAWAMIGNYLYNGETEGYSHFFNWFFVIRDPFYLIPLQISPYVMPIVNLVAFFAVEMALEWLLHCIDRLRCIK